MPKKTKKTSNRKNVAISDIKNATFDLISKQVEAKIKTKHGPYSELNENVSEHLNSFILLGYDYADNPIVMVKTRSKKDMHALETLFDTIDFSYDPQGN